VVLAYLALVLILVLVVKVQDRISELERFGDENQALGGLLIILIYASTVGTPSTPHLHTHISMRNGVRSVDENLDTSLL
jgi:hypothetical protein